MNYLAINKEDMCNGEGSRVVLWVSGCEHHCINCRSKFSWDCNAGSLFTEDTFDEICKELDKDYHKGITLSGGDPLATFNRSDVTILAETLKSLYPTKDIWCYTGYTFDEVKDFPIMGYIDILVDGRYIEELSTPSPMWCGSSNQRVIDVQKSLNKGEVVLYDSTNLQSD